MSSVKGSVLYKCELCCDITREGPSCQWDLSNEEKIHSEALMSTLTKNVHIMWGSHSSRSYNTVHPPPLSPSLSVSLPVSLPLDATCRVYRTISCAPGLFNVVIQAEHNCVPPSDRRLRTSSLLTKKPATQRWGRAHLREEIFLCPPPPSFFTLPFLLVWWKERFKG